MNEIQVVIFEIDSNYYGVDIMKVQEILKMAEITKIPNSKSYVEGVLNLRGTIIPILDIKTLLMENFSSSNKPQQILVLRCDNIKFGILVEKVNEAIYIDKNIIEPADNNNKFQINGKYIEGIAKTDNRLILMLNIEELISEN